MIGNSSKLLSILAPYSPAPWRERYSLARLFFNFYLLVMGSFVAIAIFADFRHFDSGEGHYRRLHQPLHARHHCSDRRRTVPKTAFKVAAGDRCS
jgi:hypothetical protein